MSLDSVRHWLEVGHRRLGAEGAAARAEAELLLAHALRRSRTYLYTWPLAEVPEPAAADYRQLLERRAAGRPMAYLLGRKEFWSLPLRVTPAVLIPRPETECLVEAALRLGPAGPARVLDLGTGSGAIALALASERPYWRVTAVDCCEAALAVARDNARRLRLEQVRWLAGDWFGPLGEERFDLILSNPPYVRAGDPHLQRGDPRFEPAPALVGGVDGLAALRRIIATAPAHLLPDGWLLVEHGHDQAGAVLGLLEAAGLEAAFGATDYAGLDRLAGARRAARTGRQNPAGLA